MSSKKYKRTSTADTNLVKVQQLGANLRGVIAVNTNAAARYLKFYDKDEPVVVGTDGINFKLGLVMAITTGASDTDNTAPGAGDVILTVLFE
jgi:hypothetical protein